VSESHGAVILAPVPDGRKFDPAFIPPDAIRHYDIELVAIVKDAP
jgi:hypothetical protein